VPPRAAADKAVAAVLVAIPVPMVGVTSEVTLAAPPLSVAVEETREGKLPISPGGGTHGVSLPSEPKAPEGRVAGMELGRPVASHANEVVEICLTTRRVSRRGRWCRRGSWWCRRGSRRWSSWRLGPPAVHRRVT